MSESKLYNTSTSEGYIQALDQLHYFKSIGASIEIKQIRLTRTNAQNRALHLYCTHCADALNNAGEFFIYRDYKNVEYEMMWSGEMFKEYWIKPIIKVLYDYKSTTELKTNQIDQIIDVISKRFGEIGIQVDFPSEFGYYLKQIGY